MGDNSGNAIVRWRLMISHIEENCESIVRIHDDRCIDSVETCMEHVSKIVSAHYKRLDKEKLFLA